MPRNATGTIAIYRDVSAVVLVALSFQESGVRCRAIPAPSTTVALPSGQPNDGDSYEVSDADGSCSPANALIVVPPAGTTIRGAANFTATEAFETLTVTFDAKSGDWIVAESVTGAASTVHWANDLASSSNTHQWVSGISGTNGTGATCTVRTGLTLEQTQSAAQTPQVFFRLHPFTPGVAPYETFMSTSVFHGTDDNAWALGYNASNSVPAEPQAVWNIEPNFHASVGPDVFQLEHYISVSVPGVLAPMRPMGYVADRTLGNVTPSITFAGDGFQINGGPVNGPYAQQVKFVANGIQVFPAAYNVTALGSLGLSAVTFLQFIATGVAAATEFSADVIAWGDHLRANTAFFDNVNGGAGNLLFYPNGGNKGALGFGGNRWGAVNTNALSTAQVTKTAAYVIDSAGANDCIVWVDTSATPAFALTLPAPTLGRRLVVQDVGGNLTVANVTLTRHGAEKINGAAANLALITNRATWEITSDGTDWITGKSVTGG
jgi:hypothetical protein